MDTETARARLQERLAELRSDEVALENENAGESQDLSAVHQHAGDQGSDISELDRENALIERSQAERADIETALARIDEGTYGTCIDCGQQIPDERLDARPEVLRCIADQEKHDGSRR